MSEEIFNEWKKKVEKVFNDIHFDVINNRLNPDDWVVSRFGLI